MSQGSESKFLKMSKTPPKRGVLLTKASSMLSAASNQASWQLTPLRYLKTASSNQEACHAMASWARMYPQTRRATGSTVIGRWRKGRAEPSFSIKVIRPRVKACGQYPSSSPRLKRWANHVQKEFPAPKRKRSGSQPSAPRAEWRLSLIRAEFTCWELIGSKCQGCETEWGATNCWNGCQAGPPSRSFWKMGSQASWSKESTFHTLPVRLPYASARMVSCPDPSSCMSLKPLSVEARSLATKASLLVVPHDKPAKKSHEYSPVLARPEWSYHVRNAVEWSTATGHLQPVHAPTFWAEQLLEFVWHFSGADGLRVWQHHTQLQDPHVDHEKRKERRI